MKKLILLFTLLAFIDVTAQTRPANIEIPITIFDNSGLPNSSRVLTCGIDSMATDSIDSFLDELWRYCPFAAGNNSDCIPYDHFEAVLDLPVPSPDPLWFGSFKDFRNGMIPYSGTKTYKIVSLAYGVATAIYISWDFPVGVTGLLQDGLGGLIFNYQMPDSGTYTNPHLLQLGSLGINLILSYQNTVPVELNSFKVSVLQNEKAVQLNWKTATETNNSGFEVERQVGSGQSAVGNWETIGFVPGFGTTTEPKSYSFVDEDVTTGTYKYRLKQIDFNGSFEYSNEIEVEVDFTPENFVLYQNYSNPFNPSTVISYQLPVTSKVTLIVYDVLGNEVATLVNEEKQPGVYEVEFDASTLASGMYLYKLQASKFVQTKKLILSK